MQQQRQVAQWRTRSAKALDTSLRIAVEADRTTVTPCSLQRTYAWDGRTHSGVTTGAFDSNGCIECIWMVTRASFPHERTRSLRSAARCRRRSSCGAPRSVEALRCRRR